jgi:DNA polymerase
MARSLDPETKKAVASRIRYYRDMGIYDFYRRGGAVEADLSAVVNTEYTEETITIPKRKAETQLQGNDPITALRQIREDIGDCTRCRLHKQGRKQIVFGVGSPHAELMFVGEGPGADEDEQGEPFVGRAGQLLNKMIEAMGLKREQVYIANIVKCRPPGNRTPEKDECDTCSPFLLKQIEVIRPKAIVALGAVAAKTLLGVADSMNNLRQRSYDFRGTTLFVTYHPAYLLRDPRQKAETWKDLQKVMAFLGLELPRKD